MGKHLGVAAVVVIVAMGLGGSCVSGSAQADALGEPLVVSSRSPLVQIHAVPAARSGEVLAATQSMLSLSFDAASHFIDEDAAGERIVLDGETHRLEWRARSGLGDGWEVGVVVPYMQHSGGGLDGFIDSWHDFWGLPDGGRPQAPRDVLRYRYTRNGAVLLDVHEPQSGLGDMQLQAAYRLWQSDRSAAALAATVKLPTGDAERLTGDGATATDITFAISTDDWLGSGLRAFANIGAQWLERGEVLSDQQRDSHLHAEAGLGWRVLTGLELKAQVQAHSALYDSALTALGDDAAQLILGGTAQLSPHWLLDIGVGEDIRVDTAPDVTLQIALRWRP